MNKDNGSGVGICGILFLIFLVLKLTGTIAWSWWWVTAPLWGGIAVVIVLFLVAAAAVSLSVAWR